MLRRVTILLCLLALSGSLSAQMVLIPQQVRDSVNMQTTVADSPLIASNGGKVAMGTVAEDGGVWSGVVTLQNKGDKPLVITRITTTCGCLQAKPESKVLAAGASCKVELRFNPRGRIGAVSQRVMIYSSLSDSKPTAIVEVSGVVRASADRASDYPYSHGALLLRSEKVTVEGRGVVRVACYNSGDKPLTISADPLLSPAGVSVTTEPSPLAPKSEGDLVIRFEREIDDRDNALYLKGLDVTPRERRIELIKKNR